MIECNLPACKQQYIGETHRNIQKATGKHFNLPGHSLSNMEVLILEKVKINNLQYRKEREEYHIRKFDTFLLWNELETLMAM